MTLRGPAFRILLAGLLPVLAGCSTSRMTVDFMVPVLENTTEVALRTPDAQLVGEALPTSILLLEGMLETHPKQRDVARMAAMYRFAYAFGFVEDENPERALGVYDAGRELAWRSFGREDLERAIREGTFDEMHAALAEVKEKDTRALLWVAANWGMWIQLNLGDTRAVADVARLMPLADRVAELDETLFWGMPRVLLGALHAARPVVLGGSPDRSKAEFEEAFRISDRNLLIAQVFFAKSYCVQTFDEDAFRSSLREVLDAPAGRLPEAALLNQIARAKARLLLDRAEEIFE
ncbi:MAG TPA: TRAP transporter TatT component family protein [bacterium]|nr:TRAP transporter TatT component family protein [bacterium]